MQVAVLGLGYVGCVTAACLAEMGHDVVGVDTVASKVAAIEGGRSPIVEPGLDELVAAARAQGRLRAHSDVHAAVAAAAVSLVSVGTPSRENGSLDLTYVTRVCTEIGEALRDVEGFRVVVLRSTMLPGSVAEVVVPALEAASGKRADVDFGVAMCPEFLRESVAIADFHRPPFTVLGVRDPRTEEVLRALFRGIAAPVHVVDVATAEGLKYACNAFHAVKVTFANEMARFCDASGVDPRPLMSLFTQDAELNISPRYLRPGFAFGGSCLPKDVRAMVHRARMTDQDLPLLTSLLASNDLHVERAFDRIMATHARRVALLGLSFKAGTDDLRESPFVTLAERLIGKGIALSIYDPVVNPGALVGANRAVMEERLPHLMKILHPEVASALEGVELVVLATSEPSVVRALRDADVAQVVDLTGSLRPDDEAALRGSVAGGFRGVAW